MKSHGAVGDGVSDDHPAVMAAVAEAVHRGGGTVFFPAGEYALSASIGAGADGFDEETFMTTEHAPAGADELAVLIGL